MTHSAHASDLLTHSGGPAPGSAGTRFGFFTDTSVCIGCKACEVACKEWNQVPPRESSGFTGDSMDNTGDLGADSWRHVAFVEQAAGHVPAAAGAVPGAPTGLVGVEWFGDDPGLPAGAHGASAPADRAPACGCGSGDGCGCGSGGCDSGGGCGSTSGGAADAAGPSGGGGSSGGCGSGGGSPGGCGSGGGCGPAPLPEIPVFNGEAAPAATTDFRWLMSSDVCKHCTEAACLEVCPTGAIFYTEFDTVVVQDDVCNGCGYCVTACPYGVIERRSPGQDGGGGAFKCTLCYDRMKGSEQPACAQACPTDSIQFGPLDELRERAGVRAEELIAAGVPGVQLYGADPDDGVGGNGAFFLLLDDPEVYGLPPDPVTPTRHIGQIWRHVGLAALGLVATVSVAFVTDRR